jgi:hypothetical protein
VARPSNGLFICGIFYTYLSVLPRAAQFSFQRENLCVAIVTSGLIINAGRLIGVGFMMITLGIVAVFVFIAVTAAHSSRAR